jgi:hypothetical protein
MDFKSILSQLDQLDEATEKTKTGIKHTAEPGGYGRKDDEDEEGNKVKDTSAEKKGRGRPKKATSTSGEDKKYDASALSAAMGGGKKPSKEVGKVSKKHSLKEYFDQLDQALLEGETIEKKGGRVHKGTYGTSHEAGDEGVKKAPTQRGRGRPKKDADETGEVKKYDFSAFGAKKGVKLPAWDKNKTTKHSLKEDTTIPESQLYYALSKFLEAGESGVYRSEWQPADAMEVKKVINLLKQGDVEAAILRIEDEWPFMDSGALDELFDNWATKKSKQPFNVWKMIDKVKAQHNMDLDEAEQIQIKPASQMPKKPGQTSQAQPGQPQQVQGQQAQNTQVIAQGDKTLGTVNNPQLAQQIKQSIGKGEMTLMPDQEMKEGDIGKHNNATTGFDALVRKLTPKYGKEAATRIAGSQMKKIKEADQPPRDALASPLTFEAKDLPGNQDKLDVAEPKGKLDAKDFKELSKKKKVKEGMNTRLKAARHAGKSHALGKQGYNCSYDDMEESRHYHEGFKEGLDECYGQMPIQGYVGEVEGSMPATTVPGMASQELHGGMDEGNAFTAALKRTPTGGKFSVGGKSFTDHSSIEESPFAFESLEKQLSALLESKEDVAEGMTVSISKGQQGAPDSVSVSAQDAEADQLLGLIKSAGLGLFGGDEQNGYGAPQGGQPQHGGLDVVGDHDGMMALIKKVTGGEAGNGDYADEEGHADEHGHEGPCNECGGMMEAGHACSEGAEMVDEVESEDQMTYQMAEDNPPDSGEAEEATEIADTAQSNQAAAEYNPKNDVDEGAGGPEASEEPVEKITPDEEDQSDEEGEKEESAEEEDKADKESMSESMFVNLYKKLTLISEESTSEKDNKAEKAGKKVAKDIGHDEGKDDDKKDKKKIDEWANDAGPGKSASDTAFETDIDFMMNVISGGLNKRKQTGQTTIPVIAGQNRTTSRNTTDINESKYSSDDAVAQWKKLAGLK